MQRQIAKARKRFRVEQSELKALDEKDLGEIIREFEDLCCTVHEAERKAK